MFKTQTIALVLFWICGFPGFLGAQGITISGRIVDSETLEPLPYTHIFIDQTTIGAVSDFNGEYMLEHVQNGDYKLVFSFVGYEMYYTRVSVGGKDLRVSARLIPQKELLQSVEVKGTEDKEWEKQLKQFNRVFFGENDLGRECTILNPWVLDFTYDKTDKIFRAVASAPLQIVNKALGYNMECTLQLFSFDKKSYKIRGLYKFEEINTLDPKEANRWTRNRRRAYQGSLRFLFKSIIDQHASENGFELYSDHRPSSYAFNSGYFVNELGRNVFNLSIKDIVSPAGRPGYYKITLDKRIEIHHTTAYARTKTYRDVTSPVSWVESEKGFILVSQEGGIVNSDQIITSGELNNNRVGAMLPLNYSPGSLVVVNYLTKRNLARRMQEKLYVQTDKGFYYPGENLWFKVYMSYANQSLSDSLSRVLYAEVVDPAKVVVDSKILQIDSSMAFANFNLTEQYQPGRYYLRLYTNWMRNYGEESHFTTAFIVMDRMTKLKSTTEGDNGDFIFDLMQTNYPQSAQINLSIGLDSINVDTLANCSISISPLEQATSPIAQSIKDVLTFQEDLPKGTLIDLVYPIEYDLTINGRVLQSKRRNKPLDLYAIQGKNEKVHNLKTDGKGNFKLEGLDFNDTLSFSFQARDNRGRIVGKTELLGNESPLILNSDLSIRKVAIDTINLSMPISFEQRVVKDSIVHEQLIEPSKNTSSATYADYVITSKDLEKIQGNQNILLALQRLVPGLRTNPATGSISLNRPMSGTSEVEPLIVLDGIPVNSPQQEYSVKAAPQIQQETANVDNARSTQEASLVRTNQPVIDSKPLVADINSGSSSLVSLNGIMVSGVSRVEVTKRASMQYGTLGTNGVIAIYTKVAQGKNKDVKTFDIFTVKGFSMSTSFSPRYPTEPVANMEYTPTIYWNPKINVTPGKQVNIQFNAPRKNERYLIRVEGLSVTGKPVSGSMIFQTR